MRIISGKLKGNKLLSYPSNLLIRPTTDRLKETLFSIIQSEKYSEDIVGKNFLDLCSGSGGIGLEAFSRGAKKIYMVDKSQNAINLIYKNVSKLKVHTELENKIFILKLDITKINTLKLPNIDFVYFDPPYRSKIYLDIIKIISTSNFFKNSSILFVESNYPIDLGKINLNLMFLKKIGSSYLQGFKKWSNSFK